MDDQDAGSKTGYVYAIQARRTNIAKVGYSAGPAGRLGGLQTGSPVPLYLVWKIPGSRQLERTLHRKLAMFHTHGEWFDFGPFDPVAVIANAAGDRDALRLAQAHGADDELPAHERSIQQHIILALRALDERAEPMDFAQLTSAVGSHNSYALIIALRTIVESGLATLHGDARWSFAARPFLSPTAAEDWSAHAS